MSMTSIAAYGMQNLDGLVFAYMKMPTGRRESVVRR